MVAWLKQRVTECTSVFMRCEFFLFNLTSIFNFFLLTDNI